MAYNEVNEDNVYLCVGHPLRKDIENIVKWLLNDTFSTAFNSILSMYKQPSSPKQPSSHRHCCQYLSGAKLRLSDLHNDDSNK